MLPVVALMYHSGTCAFWCCCLPNILPPDPKALLSVAATPASTTSVRVSWVYSANSSTLTSSGGYRIQYRAVSPQGLSDAGNVTVSHVVSSYIIYGLEEGVRYKVTVNAYVGSSSGVPRSAYVSTYTAGMFKSLFMYALTPHVLCCLLDF